MRVRKNDYFIECGGRCKQALYLRRHRVIKMPGRGYRCKYCDRILSDIRFENESKQKRRAKKK